MAQKRRPAAKRGTTFSEFERSAIKERAVELLADKDNGEQAVLAKIAMMKGADRAMARRIHAIVKRSAPSLTAKTWYGMPAYANRDGKVVCFFQDAAKFKARYATLGFNDAAKLDEGTMWPTAFALKKLGTAEEKKIAALVKRAIRRLTSGEAGSAGKASRPAGTWPRPKRGS